MRRVALATTLVLTAWFGVSILKGQTDDIKRQDPFQKYYQPEPSADAPYILYRPLGSGATPQPVKIAQPPFVHTVVVYLKKDAPPAKVEALIVDCHKILAKIPTVRSLWAGRPSDKSTGNLVVKDYSVSLLLLFDNYEGLLAYEEDPTHKKFVETYLPIVEKIQVYDFLNQTK